MLGTAPLSSDPVASAPHAAAVSATAVATLTVRADLAAVASSSLAGRATVSAFAGRVQRVGASLICRASLTADLDVTYAAVAIAISTGSLRVVRTIPIRGVAVAAVARAQADAFAISLFEDLVSNPSRRRVYAIEIQPVLLVPYEDAA